MIFLENKLWKRKSGFGGERTEERGKDLNEIETKKRKKILEEFIA